MYSWTLFSDLLYLKPSYSAIRREKRQKYIIQKLILNWKSLEFCESFSKKNSIIWENDQKQNSISANEKQMKFAFPAYD